MIWKLVYREKDLGEAWSKYFSQVENVEIIEADICHTSCDALVSPANSFGFMDGGLDYAISERLGWDLQKRLQTEIAKRPAKELLVGEALLIETDDPACPWLVSAPTMRVPMRLRQSINAYLAMKAIISTTIDHPEIQVVAIPGLGTGIGALAAETAALQMWTAFKEIALGEFEYPENFGRTQRHHIDLNIDEINLWDP